MRVAHPYMRGLGADEALPKSTARSTLEDFARRGMTAGTWSVVDVSGTSFLRFDSSDTLNQKNFGSSGLLSADDVDAAWRAGEQIQLRPGENPYWKQGGIFQMPDFLQILGSHPTPEPPQVPNTEKVFLPQADAPKPSGGSDVRGAVDLSSWKNMAMFALFLATAALAYHVIDRIGR